MTIHIGTVHSVDHNFHWDVDIIDHERHEPIVRYCVQNGNFCARYVLTQEYIHNVENHDQHFDGDMSETKVDARGIAQKLQAFLNEKSLEKIESAQMPSQMAPVRKSRRLQKSRRKTFAKRTRSKKSIGPHSKQSKGRSKKLMGRSKKSKGRSKKSIVWGSTKPKKQEQSPII